MITGDKIVREFLHACTFWIYLKMLQSCTTQQYSYFNCLEFSFFSGARHDITPRALSLLIAVKRQKGSWWLHQDRLPHHICTSLWKRFLSGILVMIKVFKPVVAAMPPNRLAQSSLWILMMQILKARNQMAAPYYTSLSAGNPCLDQYSFLNCFSFRQLFASNSTQLLWLFYWE